MAMSDIEIRVALALEKFEIPFEPQFQLFGGWDVAGGIIVDFVVYNPMATPLEVYGEYWHTGQFSADDNWKLAREQEYFQREPIVLWGEELQDQEMANQTIRKKVWNG